MSTRAETIHFRDSLNHQRQQDIVDKHRYPVFVMVAGDQIGRGPHFEPGMAHRDAQAGVLDHRDVVDVVANGADRAGLDSPQFREMQDGGPFAGVTAQELAHGSDITRTALHESLNAADDSGEGDLLENEHLALGADGADVEQGIAAREKLTATIGRRCPSPPVGVDLRVLAVLADVVVERLAAPVGYAAMMKSGSWEPRSVNTTAG